MIYGQDLRDNTFGASTDRAQSVPSSCNQRMFTVGDLLSSRYWTGQSLLIYTIHISLSTLYTQVLTLLNQGHICTTDFTLSDSRHSLFLGKPGNCTSEVTTRYSSNREFAIISPNYIFQDSLEEDITLAR